MGTWSATVMGGDTPLDAQAALVEQCGVKYGDFQDKLNFSFPAMFDELTQNLNKMMEYCDQDVGEYGIICTQVLGVMLMEAGVAIPDTIKAKIIQATKDDFWAKEDNERKHYMDLFADQIAAYDGTPQETAYEALFDLMSEYVAK